MIQKQPVQISFAQGLDLKTDPFQVSVNKFLSLKNTVFDTGGLLQKRNGFGSLPSLNASYQSLTTYKNNLLALGVNLSYYNSDTFQWQPGAKITNVQNKVTPIVRSSNGQTAVDSKVAANGLTCTVYLDSGGAKNYVISDSMTGEYVSAVTPLPSTATSMRVFVFNNNFLITFVATTGGTPHLQYIPVPINSPNTPGAVTDLSAQVKSLTAGYDALVLNGTFFVAWNASDGGGAVRIRSMSSTFAQSLQVVLTIQNADLLSLSADINTGNNSPTIWVTWWDSGSTNGFSAAFDVSLNSILTPTQVITAENLNELTTAANAKVNTLFYQITNTYSYNSVRTDYVNSNTITQLGVVGTKATILRSVGLAGKAFYFSPTKQIYTLVSYNGAFQPTYFLIDSTGSIVSKLAYSNGGGYAVNQVLASPSIINNDVYYGYLYKDLLLPINKNVTATAVGGIYTQTGVNLVKFSINSTTTVTAEIGNDLHLSGGYLSMYDGVKPVEHNFHVFPENIKATWSVTGGSMAPQPDGITNVNAYAYQITYEWTDAVGNIHRSAPSIPLFVTTTGTGASGTGSVTLNIPNLRLTAKTAPNGVRIMIYRWSVANPVFYLADAAYITSPIANDPTTDSVTVVNVPPDVLTGGTPGINGNPILYTNGGVVENIGPPATPLMTLFKSRLFLLDAEDRNLLWYSKQVIENTPVEMSDLFTLYVAPTTGSQGSTGDVTSLFPMDDKLIIGKQNAFYYITGNGPDNTGSQNDFSDPVFITATVGCVNQQSFVMIPDGLMFQSDKGIWILKRDLSTMYIGAPVDNYTTGAVVKSALSVPGTNQVRFTMDSGITLMYDYYYGEWSTFTGIPGVSSTLFQGNHTFLNAAGQVLQETPGQYLDGTNPVLISFTTSWIKLMGLQGFQRAYYFYLLANFLSPHKLSLLIAYDYNANPIQASTIIPSNFAGTWGSDALYGNGQNWGGGEFEGSVEQHRVFLVQQKCQSFQITAQEMFDPSYGTIPGAGLTISGLNLIIGAKKGYPVLRSSKSVG